MLGQADSCRVWAAYPGPEIRQEWLLIRKDPAQITYVLSNAPEDIFLEQMAWRKSQRYLIERSHQDAKDELVGMNSRPVSIAPGNITWL